MNLTKKFIEEIKPTGKLFYVRDTQKGFAVRVYPTGAKDFVFIYEFTKRRKHLNLGKVSELSLAEARKEYTKALLLLQSGVDPSVKMSEEKADIYSESGEALTVAELSGLYLETYSKVHHSPDWNAIVRQCLKSNVVPSWGTRMITDIKRKDAIKFIERIAIKTPGQARTVLRICRGMFEYALEREYVVANPFLKIPKAIPSVRVKERSRVLDDDEIRKVWGMLSSGPGEKVTRDALKMVLITGQRPDEVCGMTYDEISENWWTIPASRTKNDKSHRIFLTPSALAVIGTGEGYVFTSLAKNKEGTKITRRSLSQLVSDENKKKSGEIITPKYFGLPRWTPHDLRRTVRTNMSRLKIPQEHCEAVINHAKEGMVKVYDHHEYDDEKKCALLKWECLLLEILSKFEEAA